MDMLDQLWHRILRQDAELGLVNAEAEVLRQEREAIRRDESKRRNRLDESD